MDEEARWSPPRWVIVTDIVELAVMAGFSVAYIFGVPVAASLDSLIRWFGPAVLVFTLHQSLTVACHLIGEDDPRCRRWEQAAGNVGLVAFWLAGILLVLLVVTAP